MSKKLPPSKPSTRLATTLSIIAIVLSGSSWWLNYASSLPAIFPKVELVEPIAVGKQIHFKVLLENTGKTTAKHITPQLGFKFARADVPFEATYNDAEQALTNTTTSDLIPWGTRYTHLDEPVELGSRSRC
jgi:hypothetical protein